jgi:outer membrane autotransporter protein
MQVASMGTPSPSAATTSTASGDPWMRAFGSFASGAAQGGLSGFNQQRGGVIFGDDRYLDANWTLGAAVQYAHTSLSYNDGSASSGADSYNGILYDGWRDGALYVNSTAGFGWNSYGSNRTLIIGGYTATPSGSFSGWDASASAETGYTVQAGTLLALPPEMLTLTPYAGLDYTRTHTDGFTESGDGVSNLIFQASDGNSLVSTVGVRAGTRVEIPDYGAFLPEIHLAWQRENMDQTQNSNAAFVGSPGSLFSVTGAQYGRDSAIAGFGLTQELSQQFKAFVTYDAKLNGGYTEQTISAGLRVEF